LRFGAIARRLLGMRLVSALLLALALSAAPAFAQAPETPAPVCSGSGDAVADCTSGDEPTVGEPDVITDPADEVEPDDPALRGELHVLGDSARASSEDEEVAGRGSRVAGTAAAPQTPAATDRAAPAGELPFTGVEAWVLALFGSLLLAAGLRLRATA
jgi:hypothetical protein